MPRDRARSRSRSPRGRRRGRSRSGGSKSRSRSRSRHRHRHHKSHHRRKHRHHHRRSRSRSRSRSRGRHRGQHRRRRHSSSSRSRSRERRSRDTGRKGRKSRSKSPGGGGGGGGAGGGAGAAAGAAAGAGSASGGAKSNDTPAMTFSFNAVQVAEHFVEVLNAPTTVAKKVAGIAECFAGTLETFDVMNDAKIFTSLAQFTKDCTAVLTEAPSMRWQVTMRVFFESDEASDPTFALDFVTYSGGVRPPAVPAHYFEGNVDEEGCIVVLYEVADNKVARLWGGLDVNALGTDASTTLDDIEDTLLYSKVEEVLESANLKGTPKPTFNNYHNLEVW